MRFLSVADRELRAAARQKATYRARWITAALFFGLLAWLLWVFRGMSSQRAGVEIFGVFSVLTFLYCLLMGAARTADCISVERREGTLGLLFLTNLNSAEIVAGKLCSSALASVYGLMAIFPMLALPLLLGGVTFGHFARTVLGMLDGILFALACGLLASVLCRRQFMAVALANGLTLGIGGGLIIGAAAAHANVPTRWLSHWLAPMSPFYALMTADGSRPFGGANQYWLSAAAVAGLSLGGLGLATLLLARGWRDRPKKARTWPWLRFRRAERAPCARRAAFRRRLLGINPLFWLAGRQRVSAPIFMLLALALTLITVYLAAPYFGRVMRAGTFSSMIGYLFAWLWTGLAIHALVLYYAAMTASQRLAEDRQTGALELILSTPTTERTISTGLWLAFLRRMLFPALLAVLVHSFFIWMCLVVTAFTSVGQIPFGVTPGELFWSVLLDKPLRGRVLPWEFGFMMHIGMLMLVQLMLAWVTLGWVGRWLGLRMKHPGFAPMASLALLFIPPILLFSLACYLADEFRFARLPERRFLPAMMWVAFGIGSGHCLALSLWAASRLRHNLRAIAMSRYQPLPRWRWRLPTWRGVRRFATATTAVILAIVAVVVVYYGYSNWRSQRAWSTFQASLKKRGETLSLSGWQPKPAPGHLNFARSPAFLDILGRTNSDAALWFDRMKPLDLPSVGTSGNTSLTEWSRQSASSLHPFVAWTKRPSNSSSKRRDDAAAILQALQPMSGTLRQLAAASSNLTVFQSSTNLDARAVLRPDRQTSLLLERLHLLFQARACASLALGQTAEAAQDVLTGLRLAQLARQLPDARSMAREQALLTRSMQALWEGLSRHAWSEPQLVAFQNALAEFNLLADYSNAVHRVVLANIEVWRTIPGSTNSNPLLSPDYGYEREAWRLQPRAWWFESCIQLYNAGQNAIGQVDFTTGEIRQAVTWSDLDGLPLDSSCRELLQVSWWGAANPPSLAFAQTAVNQAAVACALERFHLANHAYPDTLDRLVPAFLARIPSDALTGRPLIYQPVEERAFILRGVGPNRIDDRKNTPSDDWLWAYSTNAPSAQTNSNRGKRR